jgi:HK97 family phage prohead protease
MNDRYTTLAAKVDSGDALKGIISGTAMKYGVNIPRGPRLFERVEPGTFKAQLSAPNRVTVLWQHDGDAPIGRATSLKDVGDELRFEALISQHADIPEARKALALLDEGVIDEVSVGFEWGTWHEERDDEAGTFTIVHTKARLREFSVVTFGALGQDATVKSVASAAGMIAAPINIDAYRARLAGLRA